MTDRALLLSGDPGTGKSWLSEHLAAAISGNSTLVIQGTQGTTEEQILYSWNYADLIANGPSRQALVKSPTMRGMENGCIVRFEEISRCTGAVQDALISLLSESTIHIPELGDTVRSQRGFALIATANTRDRGIHEMSQALLRRFVQVILPHPNSLEDEVELVSIRATQIASELGLSELLPDKKGIEQVVCVLRELRNGETCDKSIRVSSPQSISSAAQAIAMVTHATALAQSTSGKPAGDKEIGLVIRNQMESAHPGDIAAWEEYKANVLLKRKEWKSMVSYLTE
jgi:MoxR-like ATPase